MRVRAAIAGIVLVVIGCANAATPSVPSAPPSSAPPSPTPPALSPSPTSTQTPVDGRFSGNVDIGEGKSFHLDCVGSGSPTVILAHGLGASSADWGSVPDGIEEVTHACAVDRLGAGDSSPATADRTTSAIVDDLHALLDAAGIATPIVLVGHSIAGLDLRLHAGRYPEDIAGMVFVDPTTVGQPAAILAALPPRSATEGFGIRSWRMLLEDGWPEPSATKERYDVAASEDDVAAVTSFGDIPVIVLSAGEGDESLPEPTRSAVQDAFYALHDELAAMSTTGRREVIVGAGHIIQLDRPEAVVGAVVEVVKGARDP